MKTQLQLSYYGVMKLITKARSQQHYGTFMGEDARRGPVFYGRVDKPN